MMPFKPLTPSLSVAPQLSAADVAQAAKQGFRAIIDNRPDGEEPDQLSAADMRALAAGQGMGFAHVPSVTGKMSDVEVTRMSSALAHLEGPILAYCRTGTRAATLWALSQVGTLTADRIIATAAGAGYDLAALRPQLETAEPSPESASTRAGDKAAIREGLALPTHRDIA